MRLLLVVAFAILSSVSVLRAQNPIQPLGSDYPVYLGTFATETPIANPTTSGRILWVVVAWRTQTNVVEYTIDASTVVRDGPSSLFAAYPTHALFTIIGNATVRAGVDSVFASCSSVNTSTGVTTASCVTPTSSGYNVSGDALVRRAYTYTCATVTHTGVTGGGSCSTGSDPTSDESAWQ